MRNKTMIVLYCYNSRLLSLVFIRSLLMKAVKEIPKKITIGFYAVVLIRLKSFISANLNICRYTVRNVHG